MSHKWQYYLVLLHMYHVCECLSTPPSVFLYSLYMCVSWCGILGHICGLCAILLQRLTLSSLSFAIPECCNLPCHTLFLISQKNMYTHHMLPAIFLPLELSGKEKHEKPEICAWHFNLGSLVSKTETLPMRFFKVWSVHIWNLWNSVVPQSVQTSILNWTK